MRRITFNAHGWMTGRIPKQAVADCSHSGDCTADVEHWRKRLQFEVPREQAIAYLREFGAWPLDSDEYDKGLRDMSDEELAAKVLWIACHDIAEQGDWCGLIH